MTTTQTAGRPGTAADGARAAGTVTQRLVFYCPGYDPDGDSRYRRLFVTGFSQLSRRFGVTRRIGPVERDDSVPAARWTVSAGKGDWHTETIYEVLRWDDLVRRDFARSWLRRLPLSFAALGEALRGAVLQKLFRVNWPFAAFVAYPWVVLLGLIAAAAGIGYGAASLAELASPLPDVARLGITAAVAALIVWAMSGKIEDAYVYHFLDGWIFSWQHATGRLADFDARVDSFARHIADAVRRNPAQEVLLVGHSTGATVAVEVAARLLTLMPDFGRAGPPLVLLTIGSCLSIAAFIRKAERLRANIALLATTPALSWVEYQAPQDALNAFGFDPVRDLQLDLGGAPRRGPIIRSARFRETISPATYRKIHYNFFRMHFHFLAANEIPGEYDYLMIACGPISLAERIADPEGAVRRTYGSR